MTGTRKKFRASFLAAIMVLSMVAMSAAFAGPAAANAADSVTADDIDVTQDEEIVYANVSNSTGSALDNSSVNISLQSSVDDIGLTDVNDTNDNVETVDNGASYVNYSINLSGSTGDALPVGDYDLYAGNASSPSFSGEVNASNNQASTTFTADGLQVTNFDGPVVAANDTLQTADITVVNTGDSTVTQNITLGVTPNGSEIDLQDQSSFNDNFTESNVEVDPGEERTVSINFNTGDLDEASEGISDYEIAAFTEGSPFSGAVQPLTVGTADTGTLSFTVTDGSSPREGVEVNLYLQTQFDTTVIASDTSDADGDVRFSGLATGTSDTNQIAYTAQAVPDSTDFSSTTTTRGLYSPTQTSDSSELVLESALEPEAFGVGAFDGDTEEIVGDSRTLFGNGEFDNQGEFAVFAQTQSENEENQPVNDDVEVTLTVDNTTSSDPLRFVDPDNAGENTTTIDLTITPDSPTANIDGNDSTGVYSYETFSVTADNADSDTLDDPITTEDFNASTSDIGTRDVDVDPDVTATSDNTVASSGLTNSVSYVLQGEQTVTGEVRDGISQDELEGVNVWVAYEGQSDKSYEFINSTFRDSDDEPFLSTTSASDGAYTIRGLAGTDTNFTVYAYSEDTQEYNRINVSGSAANGSFTNGAVAHRQNLTTGSDTGDAVTHDIPLFEEEIDYEYRLNATVQDSDGEQAKSVEVPQEGTRTVEVAVEQQPLNQPGDWTTASDGQEITLDLEANPTSPSAVGELADTTLETSAGTVETTFEAFNAGSGTVNVTAETENDDGTTANTTAGEQAQIEVFGTATITGDIVNDNSENIVNATVELYETADTSGEPVAEDRTGAAGSFAFTEIDDEPIPTGGTYTVLAIDEEGNSQTRTFGPLTAGTNDGDIVIVGGVVGSVDTGSLTFSDQTLGADGAVTVEDVSTGQPSTVVVTYQDSTDANIVAGTASANNLDGEDVDVTIEDDGGFPGNHTAWVFNTSDVSGVSIGDDATPVADSALDSETANITEADGSGGSLADYQDEDGNTSTDLLRDAIDDWRNDEISTGLLRDVINNWRA